MRGGGRSPYHTLEHWSEHLIPRRHPDNLPPCDIQVLSLGTHEVAAFLIPIGGGCREADVGSDALEVGLLEAKVEAERRFGDIHRRYLGRFGLFVARGNLADV